MSQDFRGRGGQRGRGQRGRGGRGGRGRGGIKPNGGRQDGEKSHIPTALHYKKLQRMTIIDPTDAMLDLLKHKEQLQNLLEDNRINDDYLELLLEILARVYDTHMKEILVKILALFPNTVFLQKCLSRYIMQLPMKSSAAKAEKHIRNIVQLFDQLLRRFPDLYTEIPLDSLLVATMSLQSSVRAEVTQQVQDLVGVRQRIIEKNSKKDARTKKKDVEEAKPPDDFRELSVHPTTEDFQKDKQVFLRKNIVAGKYENADHYLDVQFRLLREDFIGPLREGVDELVQGLGRNERYQNLRVYNNVEIVDTVCTNSGIVYRIRFDVRRLRRVNWENSKRLIFGAFLCMSKDNFSTLVFATITDRKTEEIKEGYLQVRILGEIPDLQVGDNFQMVESPGYYESYCHILQALQELDGEKMPFSRYLVDCETTVNTPGYLSTDREAVVTVGDIELLPSGQPTYDLQKALRAKVDASVVPILESSSWPSVNHVEPNQSQLKAIQAALTKEFAIIQGPPGTGKTYVGLRIVEALLRNSKYWCDRRVVHHAARFHGGEDRQITGRPMLVVCYTNHALDQFLEGILQFAQTDIVRVGGRSTSDRLKEHNLSHKARRTAGWYATQEELTDTTKQIGVAKATLAHSYAQLVEIEQLSTVMEKRVVDELLPYVHFARYHRMTVLSAWLNMEPLPWYAPPNLANNESMDSSEYRIDEEEEDSDEDNSEEEDEDEVTENQENADEQKKNEDETIDIEEDAERLRAERELGDDFAPIERPDDVIKIGMTHDYINMVNRRARVARYEEDPRYQSLVDTILQPNQSVWNLDFNTRKALYDDWLRKYQELHVRDLNDLTRRYDGICEELKEVKHGQEEEALRQTTVIGMTTTGAAKYRNVLQKIQPRIVVVEEAAEVLEAHIVTALSKGAEHLILIGDHEQLKPNPSVYTLAKQYNLEVSLFERMVKNGMECHTLNTQHRMRPEIAQLMKHIYDNLQNHVSVENFDDIDGVSKNIFFIDHQHPEKSDDELRSHANEHEASYVVALCRYLLQQGYDRAKITVLTTYTGQLLALKRLMPKEQFNGVRVCSVDNFQGEENDIILLSLVRSNQEQKIGFLATSNRVCVALSRARMGFYCIGNISMLAGKNELWAKIKADLEGQGAIGPALPIYCRNHKKTKIDAACAADFRNAPAGGCTLPCDFRLDCGHKCEMACHPVDPEHVDYTCEKKCEMVVCRFDHRCPKQCHYGDECGPCMTRVTKTLPRCGHEQAMPCSTDAIEFECKLPCEKNLPCGHRCQRSCGRKCNVEKCHVKVEKVLRCGHMLNVQCSTSSNDIKCDVPCQSMLDCGHPCSGNCHDCLDGRVHVPCSHPCGRTLICSHPCQEPCTKDCPPCKKKCENECVHSKCHKKCGEVCTPCQEPCLWACKHRQCKSKCSQLCDRKPCNVHCRKKLKCNKRHKCVGLCGEKCPKLCRVCNKKELTEIFFGTEDTPRARFIELLDCGHVFEVHALDQWMECVNDDVTDIQLKQCPKCKTPIRKSLRYGNIIKKTLMDIEAVKKRVRDEGTDTEKTKVQLEEASEELRKKYPLALKSEEMYGAVPTACDTQVYAISSVYSSPSSAYFSLIRRIHSSTIKELNAVANQIQLLQCIYEIKTKFLQPVTTRSIKYDDRDEMLSSDVNKLERRVVESKLTSQVIGELKEEIARVSLKCKLRSVERDILKTTKTVPPAAQLKLGKISDLLSSTKKIDEKERGEIHEDLDKICNELGLGVVTPEERAEIVEAIGLAKGHWFKCRNGHIYAIGECGGAMERGVCPECKDVIGGGSHHLVEGNQLAPEMDGARHAAWSDQGNLENYDQEELRRLQIF